MCVFPISAGETVLSMITFNFLIPTTWYQESCQNIINNICFYSNIEMSYSLRYLKAFRAL